jgi:hypothetical protein
MKFLFQPLLIFVVKINLDCLDNPPPVVLPVIPANIQINNNIVIPGLQPMPPQWWQIK